MFVSLAHPYRYNEPNKRIELAEILDGIECEYSYSYKIDVENSIYEEDKINKDVLFADENNLTITGGSDTHRSHEVGNKGLTEEQYKEFLKKSGLIVYSKRY